MLTRHVAIRCSTKLRQRFILTRVDQFFSIFIGHSLGEGDFMATSKLQALWNHPAGPKTIHFWAPTFKWGISIANITDFSKPPEKLSYPQQIAITVTGVIWSRYSTVITPKNWNLFSVSIGMAGTGIYQLSRKIQHDYFSEEEVAVAKE